MPDCGFVVRFPLRRPDGSVAAIDKPCLLIEGHRTDHLVIDPRNGEPIDWPNQGQLEPARLH